MRSASGLHQAGPEACSPLKWLDLQDLIERCLGNVALADKILNHFSGQLEESLLRIEQAVDREDLQETARLAHRLKGEAASIGSPLIRECASETEAYAASGRPGETRASAARLTRACRLFQENAFTFEGLANGADQPPDLSRRERN